MGLDSYKKIDGKLYSFAKEGALLESFSAGRYNEYDYLNMLSGIAKRYLKYVSDSNGQTTDFKVAYNCAISSYKELISLLKPLIIDLQILSKGDYTARLQDMKKDFILNAYLIKRNNMERIPFEYMDLWIFDTDELFINFLSNGITFADARDGKITMETIKNQYANGWIGSRIIERMSIYNVLDFIAAMADSDLLINNAERRCYNLDIRDYVEFSDRCTISACCEPAERNGDALKLISSMYNFIQEMEQYRDECIYLADNEEFMNSDVAMSTLRGADIIFMNFMANIITIIGREIVFASRNTAIMDGIDAFKLKFSKLIENSKKTV